MILSGRLKGIQKEVCYGHRKASYDQREMRLRILRRLVGCSYHRILRNAVVMLELGKFVIIAAFIVLYYNTL